MKFNGERWELFGPIIEDTGRPASASSSSPSVGVDGNTGGTPPLCLRAPRLVSADAMES
mgnify:CR=1 FL=1